MSQLCLKALLLLLALLAPACEGATYARAPPIHSRQQQQQQPASSSTDFAKMVEAVMDRSASPCDDFYQYACGGWLASPASEIPADDVKASRVYQGGEMGARNDQVLYGILNTTEQPLLRAYFDSCLAATSDGGGGAQQEQEDPGAVARRLLKAPLALIDAIPDDAGGSALDPSVLAATAALHKLGAKALFTVVVANDLMDPQTNLFQFVQGGLGLPDSSYYLHGAPAPYTPNGFAFAPSSSGGSVLDEYKAHVADMLGLAGLGGAGEAAQILLLETRLAAITRPNASTGDFLKAAEAYHKTSVGALATAYPALPLADAYLPAAGFHNSSLPVSVAHPHFFGNLSAALLQQQLPGHAAAAVAPPTAPMTALKSYLRWMLLHHLAAFLPAPFGAATFDLYARKLQGQAAPRAPWQRCMAHINTGGLANALGKAYSEKAFGPDAQRVADALFEDIRGAFVANLANVTWLDAPTRAAAAAKAKLVNGSLGKPKVWVDYRPLLEAGGLSRKGEDLYGNAAKVAAFEWARLVGAAGSANTVDQWDLVTATPYAVPQLVTAQVSGLLGDGGAFQPQTVSAFNPESPNYLIVPAAELQLPEFDPAYPPPLLLGAAGATVGHEFTHGFDNVGHNFDLHGALRNWWSNTSLAQFEQRASCIADQYSQFEPLPGVHIDGRFTLQEDIADCGGLKLAHLVYRDRIGPDGPKESLVKGVSNDQLFFLQFGQDWCFNMTDAYERYWVKNNQHATPAFRVKGAVSNLPAFGQAFGCKAGASYNPVKRCELW